VIYMGKDKVESKSHCTVHKGIVTLNVPLIDEDLIKFAWPQDVWFHVDKLSSAHVYLRMPTSATSKDATSVAMTWETIPQALLVDCAQLVKANSIEGNKKDNITIIYTPAANLKKTGDMAVGQVGFHNDKKVKRIHVPKRENPIVNRLNKTKEERVVDHEQERIDRLKAENAVRREEANRKRKEDEELAKQRAAEKAAWDYSSLEKEVEEGEGEEGLAQKSVQEMMDDFM